MLAGGPEWAGAEQSELGDSVDFVVVQIKVLQPETSREKGEEGKGGQGSEWQRWKREEREMEEGRRIDGE